MELTEFWRQFYWDTAYKSVAMYHTAHC